MKEALLTVIILVGLGAFGVWLAAMREALLTVIIFVGLGAFGVWLALYEGGDLNREKDNSHRDTRCVGCMLIGPDGGH